MENLIKIQSEIEKIIKGLDSLRNSHINLLQQIKDLVELDSQDIVLPKSFKEILDVISTKKTWEKADIITVFREVATVAMNDQRLKRRKV